ncbi:MAG: kinase/pyrophosphorylase [Burkholderiales bacterium]|nr:kinase/pyrophosphorylase [Phycisphaerae bacterium]
MAAAKSVDADGPPTLVHVLSDSTGNLAKHMVAAFLTQFPAGTFGVRPWTFLQTEDRINHVLQTARREGGVIMHAMVMPGHKEIIRQFCQKNGIRCCDLTGAFVDFLMAACGKPATADLKALHEFSVDYSRRIDALDFTIKHDDGLGVERLREADVVLVGVSRTSKTPTCVYLAQLGYKAANVAIAIEATVPDELLEIKEKKIVGLVVDPWRLVEVRKTRSKGWNMGDTSYVDVEHVAEEVKWSKKLFAKQGWPVLDVTTTAVEETAARIVDLLKLPLPGHPRDAGQEMQKGEG